MKRKRKSFIMSAILLLLAPFLFSCENNGDDIIWDFAPINFYFNIENAEGENLLDPANPDNILSESIQIVYDGKTADAITEEEYIESMKQSRYYLPTFHGALICNRSDIRTPYLYVGEFDRAYSYSDSFKLIFGGKEFEVSFKVRNNTHGSKADIELYYYIDGRNVATDEDGHISLVIDR